MTVDAGDSLVERRRQLDRARASYVDGDRPDDTTDGLRSEIRASWDRCRTSPACDGTSDVTTIDDPTTLSDTPLAPAAELIDELGQVADSEGYVAAVTDEFGRIVWSEGSADMRRAADEAGFLPGTLWSEAAAGTNAPGLALATGRPATVFAGEHWSEPVHDWVCYAAPVHDSSGRVVGSLDLSSTWARASELAGTTVRSLARLVEARLADRPLATTDDRVGGLQVELLGWPRVTLDGHEVHLSLRQIEILAVLVLMGPCTLDQLHAQVYGDAPVSASTLKAEVSHLRKNLGGVIGSRPYSVDVDVVSDVGRLHSSLDDGSIATAAQQYGGQLLPESESPFVTDQRHHLDVLLRTRLLQSGTPSDLLRFARVHPYDVEIVEAARRRTAPDSAVAAEVAAALDRLSR
ncbi:MAG: transcriptional regulator [Actinomycetota bacterium]